MVVFGCYKGPRLLLTASIRRQPITHISSFVEDAGLSYFSVVGVALSPHDL